MVRCITSAVQCKNKAQLHLDTISLCGYKMIMCVYLSSYYLNICAIKMSSVYCTPDSSWAFKQFNNLYLSANINTQLHLRWVELIKPPCSTSFLRYSDYNNEKGRSNNTHILQSMHVFSPLLFNTLRK